MKYTALQPVTVGKGSLVKLTKPQLARMTGLVVESDAKKGLYETLVPVQFKTGEDFDTEDDLPKDLAEPVKAAPPAKDDKK